MANKRISDLDNLGATPASGDIIPITDVSDTVTSGNPNGTTKGVTFSDLTDHLATQVSLGNHEGLTSSVHGISAFGATLVDDADAATARTTLGLGTAATTASTDYATSAQGSLADSATQPGDNISTLTNDSGFIDSSGAPVQSVAGRTGAVTLSNTDVSGLGTAATQNVGTANGNVVQLDATGLPAVDGSQLTNVSGTDATKLAIASNLSDLNNAGTARTNLGLGDASTKTVGTADTNVIAVSSGTVDLGGNKLEDFDASINDQTGTAYTLVAGDNGKVVVLDNASVVTVTVPSGLGSGFNCSFVQKGAGQVSFTASSTTINNRQSHTKINGQYGVASLLAYADDTFVLAGDTAS